MYYRSFRFSTCILCCNLTVGKGHLAWCFATTTKRLSRKRSALCATVTYLEHAVVSFDCIQQHPNVLSRSPSSLLAHLSAVLDGVFSPALCLSFVHTRWGWVDSAPCVNVTSRRARVSRSSLHTHKHEGRLTAGVLYLLGSSAIGAHFWGTRSKEWGPLREAHRCHQHILRIWRNA